MSTSVATNICATFIGAEHNDLRTFGLVDEEDGKMFDSKYNEIKNSLPNAFIIWLEETRGRKQSLLGAMKSCKFGDSCRSWEPSKYMEERQNRKSSQRHERRIEKRVLRH